MRISPLNDRAVQAGGGFTLLELSLVMLIMLIMLGFAVPRFSLLFDSDLMKEAQKMAKTIDELRMQAILEGETYQLVLNTEKSTYAAYAVHAQNPDRSRLIGDFPEPRRLKAPVEFAHVWRGGSDPVARRFAGDRIEFDKIFGQEFRFRIDASGFVDPFRLEMRDGQNALMVSVVNIMGEVVIGQEEPIDH